jgi:hypothetical protein
MVQLAYTLMPSCFGTLVPWQEMPESPSEHRFLLSREKELTKPTLQAQRIDVLPRSCVAVAERGEQTRNRDLPHRSNPTDKIQD